MEEKLQPYRGCYRDRLIDARGTVVHDSGWRSNRIVNNCRVLLAALMNGDIQSGTGDTGIKKLLIGSGSPRWDVEFPLEGPPATRDSLFDTDPVEFTSLNIAFAHERADLDPLQPSSVLTISAVLQPGFPAPVPQPGSTAPGESAIAYPMREFGLVGKWNSREFLVNLVWHPVIYKDLSATLVRNIELSF